MALTHLAIGGYLAVAVATAAVLWGLGDQWWFATVMLFGHRWLLLLPALPLAAVALIVRTRLLPLVLVTALVVVGPVMGFRIGWRAWLAGGKPDARVVTFNVQGGQNPRLDDIPGVFEAMGADVMLFQECHEDLVEAARRLTGWSVWSAPRGLCLASRWPIERTEVMEEFTTSMGSIGNVSFHVLRHPLGPLSVGLLHLETPRSGLQQLRYAGELAQLRRNLILRDGGSSRASRWLAERGAGIIAGDFNMPVESRVYQRHWSRCDNAFSRTGRGFGYTRVLYRFSVRIDHVLTCTDAWTALRAWIGPDLSSDHLPVFVELRRRS